MSNVTVNQSNTQISVAAGDVETVNGNDDIITAGIGALVVINGFNDTINASHDKLSVNDGALSNNTVNGSNDVIAVPINSHITVDGTGEKINDAGHGYLALGGDAGSTDVVVGTVLEVTVATGLHLNFVGDQNNFYLGDGCLVNVAGDDDNLLGSNDRFILGGSIKGGDEIVGNNDRAFLLQAADPSLFAQLLLYGDDELIHAGVHTAVNVMTGTNDRLIGAGFYAQTNGPTNIWIGGNGKTGAVDTLTGSNFTAQTGANSNIVISGDDDTVAIGADAQLYFLGAGMTAHVGANADIFINGKGETSALDMFTGSAFTINTGSDSHVEILASSATATLGNNVDFSVGRPNNMITSGISDTISILFGASDQVVLAPDNVVTDGGSKTTFIVNNHVGATTINNFAADPLGVIDVFSGIGGYTTATDAAAGLTSDGAGGVKLALGIYGSIDFIGDTSLTAANFKIG